MMTSDCLRHQVHMLLARTPNAPAGAAGISLFLVPHLLPDGTRNDVELVRLKETMSASLMTL
jgi:3-(methylthio)propanoyl-CoA dehydrogenase